MPEKHGHPISEGYKARTCLLGLPKNLVFYGLAAVAHNIQKAAKFLRLYSLPNPTRAA